MSEYQHFIPQFILRKYSGYQEPKREDFPPGTSKDFDKARSNAKKASVNIINLKDGFDNMKIETRKTKGVCGLDDMYGPEIEKKFGLLEAKASKIIRRIEDDFASDTKRTRVSRPDKDTFQRFLFIMLYRSRKFSYRFEKTTEDYDANDKSSLLDCMKVKGFSTLRDHHRLNDTVEAAPLRIKRDPNQAQYSWAALVTPTTQSPIILAFGLASNHS